MSGGVKCNICGISGTSTYRCCGNNKNVRLKQIEKELTICHETISEMKVRIVRLVNERIDLENEE